MPKSANGISLKKGRALKGLAVFNGGITQTVKNLQASSLKLEGGWVLGFIWERVALGVMCCIWGTKRQ